MGVAHEPGPVDPEAMAGETVSEYRLVELLGRGGMGAVYRAEHLRTQHPVAVKLLLPRYTHDREMVQRFFNEARAASRAKHPGIVDIHDVGFHESGIAFIAMTLADGQPLSQVLKGTSFSLPQIYDFAQQLTDALQVAHDAGVIHRDLKPDNIVVTLDGSGGGRVTILDFGIAKLVTEETDPHGVRTQTGALMGSPRYMSPEQCAGGRNIDHRADIYALGCVLFEMIAGRSPFVAANSHAMMTAHMSTPPPSLLDLRPDCPPDLDRVIQAALAKHKDERFETMRELGEAIELVRRGEPPKVPEVVGRVTVTLPAPTTAAMAPPAPKMGLIGVVAAAAALAAAGVGWFILSAREEPPKQLPATTTVVTEQAPAPVAIRIASAPSGAAVYRVSDGVRIGETPMALDVEARDGTLEVILKHDGYVDQRLRVPLHKTSSATVTLEAAPEPPPPPTTAKRTTPKRSRKSKKKKKKKAGRAWGELIQ